MLRSFVFLVLTFITFNLAAQELPEESTDEEREALRARFMELVKTTLPGYDLTVTLIDFDFGNGSAMTYIETKDGKILRKQGIGLALKNIDGEDKVLVFFTNDRNCTLNSDISEQIITVNDKRIRTIYQCIETDILNPDGTRKRFEAFQPISEKAQLFIKLEMISTRVILLNLPSDMLYETPIAVRGFFEAHEKLFEPVL